MFLQSSTYAYNTQIHRSTTTSPYSLVLNRRPSGPYFLTACTIVPDRNSNATSPQAVHFNIQLPIAALRLKTNAHTRKSQERYKHHYDGRVELTPIFKLHDFVFVNNAPQQPTVYNNAEAMSMRGYKKW